LETRSSTSESPDCPWTTTPEARVRRSTEETADRARLVGEQAHAGRAARHLRDRPDEAVGGNDGGTLADAVVGARGDHDLLLEGGGRTRDHLGGNTLVVVREGGPFAVLEQPLQLDVLLQGRLVLDHLLLEQLVLGAELLVLRACVEEILRPAVGVAEGPRHPLDRHFHRLQRTRDSTLCVVQGPVRALAEGHRDQRERGNHQHTQHDPAPEGAGAA